MIQHTKRKQGIQYNIVQVARIWISASALAALVIAMPRSANAHEIRGYVSAKGVEFIEAQIPSYVPSELQAPPLSRKFACVTATQHNTDVTLAVNNLDLSMPANDQFRVDITLSATANGQLDIENPYACLGRAGCTDTLTIDSTRAVVDFTIHIENGVPVVTLSALDLQLNEDDIDVKLADCAIKGVVNTIIGFAKGWILDFIEAKVEEIAVTQIGPLLQEMVAGFINNDVSVLDTDVAVDLKDLLISPSGIELGIDIDLSSPNAPAACVDSDPGEPESQPGAAPPFAQSMLAHMGVAVNFGAVDDILYHVWRRGLTCITGDYLEALGIHIDFDHLTALLPGFPSGTTLGLRLHLSAPPSIRGIASQDAKVSMVMKGIEVELIATTPSGNEETLGFSLDVSAIGEVAIEPGSNALIARMQAADITRMDMNEFAATQLGFDTAQIMTMMNTQIVPKLLTQMGDLPITGSFFNFADYAIILRGLETSSEAFLQAEIDLFRAPANDTTAPETTILGSPTGIVSPRDALIRVGGTDSQIPSELLRYKVVVNDEIRPLSPITKFTIGEVGVTDTYKVQVAAIDLNGNEDITPAIIEMTVDGIAPTILISGDRAKLLDSGGTVELAWTASDDLTNNDRLLTTVSVYRLKDPTDPVSAELVDEFALGANESSVSVDVGSGSVYRVEVHVTDEAGNTASSAMLVDVSGGCGCRSAGGSQGALPILMVMMLVSLVMRRRRRNN